VILAIVFLSLELLVPFLDKRINNHVVGHIIALVLSLAVIAPFLWALMVKSPNNIGYRELWLDKRYSKGPLFMLEVLRSIIGVLIIGLLVDRLFSVRIAAVVVVPVFVLVLFVFSKRIQKFYNRLEVRFLSNLHERDLDEKSKINSLSKQLSSQSDASLWDVHMVDMVVGQNAIYIGKTLMELAWREQYGINIAYIRRGDKLIFAPERNSRLQPLDHVGIIGTDEQIQEFTPVFDTTEKVDSGEPDIQDIVVQKIVVNELNKLKGLTIRDSRIRQLTNGLVVGIERDEERILNPDSGTVFEWGDIVWIAGERTKIQDLNKK
jgi:CPA2 family monovalent cation:H+ antiporter-2